MQIRYQNVQKNITYMSVSFEFMKKVLKVHIRVLALLIPPWIVNSKKIQKNSKKIWWQRTTSVLSACQVSLGNDIRGSRGKKNLFWSADCFFCWGTHEAHSLMKLGKHLEHLSIFALLFFWIFLDFTSHGGIKRAKTRMCTFNTFFMNSNDTDI